jgi:hypothetical protein
MFRQISSTIRLPRNSRDLLHAANLRHGTDGFTSPPKESVLRIFFALKNPTCLAGFEPANLGTKGQHATSRPPKSDYTAIFHIILQTVGLSKTNLMGVNDLLPFSLQTFFSKISNFKKNLAKCDE